MTEQDRIGFLRKYFPPAQTVEGNYGIPALATMAIACIETGWGAHIIGDYNVFGIKANEGQPSVIVTTTEHHKKEEAYKNHPGFIKEEKKDGYYASTIQDKFAKYSSEYEAFDAFAKLLTSDRYKQAIGIHNPIEYIASIVKMGYSTNEGYAELADNVINSILTRLRQIQTL